MRNPYEVATRAKARVASLTIHGQPVAKLIIRETDDGEYCPESALLFLDSQAITPRKACRLIAAEPGAPTKLVMALHELRRHIKANTLGGDSVPFDMLCGYGPSIDESIISLCLTTDFPGLTMPTHAPAH